MEKCDLRLCAGTRDDGSLLIACESLLGERNNGSRFLCPVSPGTDNNENLCLATSACLLVFRRELSICARFALAQIKVTKRIRVF